MYMHEYRRHVQKCVFVLLDREIVTERERWLQQLTRLESENNILRQELEKAHALTQKVTEQAINRPTHTHTTTNNIDNHRSIGNQIANVKVTNYLADHKTYEQQTDPERVRALMDKHFEEYFFDGQQGLAKFLVDHIIRSDDGKMIMVCTDTSRKRFRFINAEDELEEDLRAKILSKKLSVPVKEVCRAVFQRITERLNEQKRGKQNALEVDFLEKKIDSALAKYIHIREFDTDECGDFLNQLAALLRGPDGVAVE
jgi:hypothetical protein